MEPERKYQEGSPPVRQVALGLQDQGNLFIEEAKVQAQLQDTLVVKEECQGTLGARFHQ